MRPLRRTEWVVSATPLCGSPAFLSVLCLCLVSINTGCSDSGGSPEDFSVCTPTATYFFDSSFSDTGNLLAATLGIYPPDPPYFQGRFSNGSVAVEFLAAALGTEARNSRSGGTNYAMGGARTGVRNYLLIPPLTDQVADYLKENRADPYALYVMRAASNDVSGYLDGDSSLTMTAAAGYLRDMVASLESDGARHFLFFNLPDLPTSAPGGTELVQEYNSLLEDLVGGLAVDARIVDVYSLVESIKNSPDRFGLTNVSVPCLGEGPNDLLPGPGGACDPSIIDPVADGFLLYDSEHLTTRVHEIIANAALDTLCPEASRMPGGSETPPFR